MTLELPQPVGFVMGGGGAFGAAQVGMLEALAEANVRADLVAGTSIGAINGVVVASDPVGAAHRLSHVWHHLGTQTILPGGLPRLVRTLWRTRTHLFDTPAIGELVAGEIPEHDISELAIPYLAMAVDADTSAPVELTSGPVLSAILASSALPGVFPAATHEGRDFYDGGLVSNVPVLEALAMGAKSLVVLDCQFPDQPLPRPTTLAEAVMYAITITMRQQVLRDLPVAAQQVPVLYLPGPTPMMISPLDFSKAAPLIDAAYRTARPFLEQVRIDGPGLHRAHVT